MVWFCELCLLLVAHLIGGVLDAESRNGFALATSSKVLTLTVVFPVASTSNKQPSS